MARPLNLVPKIPPNGSDPRWLSGARLNEIHLARVRLAHGPTGLRSERGFNHALAVAESRIKTQGNMLSS